MAGSKSRDPAAAEETAAVSRARDLASPLEPLRRIDHGHRPKPESMSMTKTAAQRSPAPAIDTLPEDIRTRLLAVQEKSGFVPNVFLTLAYRPDEFRAFLAYHDALIEKDGGLTKAEREMIVIATSAANRCQYCVIAHGAIPRIRAKNPLIADQVAVHYRKADITAAEGDARLRDERTSRCPAHLRGRFRRTPAPRLQRRRHLGYRRDLRLLRTVEPAGEFHRHAPERRVLSDGTAAEAVTGKR